MKDDTGYGIDQVFKTFRYTRYWLKDIIYLSLGRRNWNTLDNPDSIHAWFEISYTTNQGIRFGSLNNRI